MTPCDRDGVIRIPKGIHSTEAECLPDGSNHLLAVLAEDCAISIEHPEGWNRVTHQNVSNEILGIIVEYLWGQYLELRPDEIRPQFQISVF